jgi:hypothetical protein
MHGLHQDSSIRRLHQLLCTEPDDNVVWQLCIIMPDSHSDASMLLSAALLSSNQLQCPVVQGENSLPEQGIGALTQQLAQRLPADAIHLGEACRLHLDLISS